MDRRRFLAGIAAGAAGGLSGCAGLLGASGAADDGTGAETLTPAPAPTDTPTPSGLAAQGFPRTVCQEEIKPGAIAAIDDPAFGPDWDGLDVPERYTRTGALNDETVVIGLDHEAGARAYPLAVVRWHEAVNDVLDGPVLVTYCSICASGMVAERRVDGVVTTFGVTGLLWRPPDIYVAASEKDGRAFGANETGETDVRTSGNLVLYDEATRSYWSQILAQAICGSREGERLTIVPSTLTTWGAWRDEHPDAEVLLPPPHSGLL